MADNYFDQFDAPVAPVAPTGEPRGSFFDQFDARPPEVPFHIGGGQTLTREQVEENNRRNAEAEKAWLEQRSLAERAKAAAAFAASLPVRMFSRGQYGAGDIVGKVAPSAGDAITGAERDFVRANEGPLRVVGAIGEVAAGVPALNTMGHIGKVPQVPRTTTLPREPGLPVPYKIDPAPGQPVPTATQISRLQRADDATAMRELDIPAFGPALVSEQPGAALKQFSEVPIVGAPLVNQLRESVARTRDAAGRIASEYGDIRTADEAGRTVKGAIERFKDARPVDVVERAAEGLTPAQRSGIIKAPARESSLKTKQEALYSDAWSYIPADMQQGRTVKTLPRYLGDMPETRTVIDGIVARNLGMLNKSRAERLSAGQETAGLLPTRQGAIPKVALPVSGGLLGRIVEDVAAGNWRGTLQDMRNIRSDFRRLASGMADTERNTLRLSDIERIQSSVTRDMTALLQRNAATYRDLALKAGVAGDVAAANNLMRNAVNTERAIVKFARSDKFTRLSAQRLEAIEKLFNADSAESLARNISKAALDQSRGNYELLRTAKRVMRGEEWGGIASYMIHELGTPKPGARGMARDLGFSIQTAATNLNGMAPAARKLLFDTPDNPQLGQSFARLGQVINRFAGYEDLANKSRSTTNQVALAALLGGGTAFVANWQAALATAGGIYAAAKFMSSQAYVNWLTRAIEISAAGADIKSPAWQRQLRDLRNLAAKDLDRERAEIVLRATMMLDDQVPQQAQSVQ